jgi:hypothetical protein
LAIRSAAENALTSCIPLTENTSAYVELMGSHEITVALNALRCITLLFQLFPQTSSMFLNFSNIDRLVAYLTESSRDYMKPLLLKLIVKAVTHSTTATKVAKAHKELMRVIQELASVTSIPSTIGSIEDLSASLKAVAGSSQSVNALAADILKLCKR